MAQKIYVGQLSASMARTTVPQALQVWQAAKFHPIMADDILARIWILLFLIVFLYLVY